MHPLRRMYEQVETLRITLKKEKIQVAPSSPVCKYCGNVWLNSNWHEVW